MDNLFKMPKQMKITGRSSSITNAFVSSIIPTIQPTEEEILEALNILKMNKNNFQFAYCGDIASEWDHLRPLVLDKKPTGYISEIKNLVPSCGKCNQSKGNKHWKKWIESDASLSPKSKGIKDLKSRIKCLEKYEKWGTPIKIDFKKNVKKEDWSKHWQNCNDLQKAMKDSQKLSEKINRKILEKHKKI